MTEANAPESVAEIDHALTVREALREKAQELIRQNEDLFTGFIGDTEERRLEGQAVATPVYDSRCRR